MRACFIKGCKGLGDFVTLVTVRKLGSNFLDWEVGDFVEK